jgi:DNA polymerase V
MENCIENALSLSLLPLNIAWQSNVIPFGVGAEVAFLKSGAILPSKMAPIQLTPLYGYSISAGFPSPADDYIQDRLDLNELLINNKAATFFLRVQGDSMLNAGIHHGDIIVVDRAIQAVHRSIVVAVVDGDLTVKRLIMRGGSAELHAENPKYAPICLQEGQELSLWGVVTSSVHQVK